MGVAATLIAAVVIGWGAVLRPRPEPNEGSAYVVPERADDPELTGPPARAAAAPLLLPLLKVDGANARREGMGVGTDAGTGAGGESDRCGALEREDLLLPLPRPAGTKTGCDAEGAEGEELGGVAVAL